MPAQTVDPGAPLGKDIAIDHFIVIMQENHSFDQYFEMLPERGQPDADVAPTNFENPDPTRGGRPVRIFHQSAHCPADIDHGRSGIHTQYADGAMNGFLASAKGQRQALGYHDQADIPYYYALANTFSIGDRYFSAVMAPTYPNRMFALSATTFGITNNRNALQGAEQRTIFQQLQTQGQSWMIYGQGRVREALFYPALERTYPDHFATIPALLANARAGTLPALSWVESEIHGGANGSSEHPPNDIQIGQRFVAQIVDSVMRSPQWPRAAIFITYDEHGGFFDHVPPPHACPPDATAPMAHDSAAADVFERYGMRVPFIAISPFARPHHVSHQVLSHTSIMRLIQARYGLPALTGRDANSNPPYDLFDFQRPTFLTPPQLPPAIVNPIELARCRDAFP